MSKYGNRKVTLDGFTFDSIAESRRYQELKLLLAAGEIAGLEIHPRYEIIPAYTRCDGKRIRATYYEADFSYWDKAASYVVVEDVKGFQTEGFRLKRKLFESGNALIDFRIVEA